MKNNLLYDILYLKLVIIKRSEKVMEKWECPKCKNGEYEKDQFQATEGILQRYLMCKTKNLLQ